ncbi:hypothetical protein [Nocardia sp. NPDC005745]|uniref:hypothetical protein n=1 Tax=Nocardia sp. NPDC005745 TaxID=3157061 RepID=UPI0033EA57AD
MVTQHYLSTRRKTLEVWIPRINELLDRYGVDFVWQLPAEQVPTEAVRWLISSQNTLRPNDDGEPGTVRLWLPAQTGIMNDEQFDVDVARALTTDRMLTKVEKLRKHPDVAERHLAIGVMMYGPGFTLLDQLLFGPGQPPRWDPRPGLVGVTHIWLTGGAYDVLAWDVAAGWNWRRLPRWRMLTVRRMVRIVSNFGK